MNSGQYVKLGFVTARKTNTEASVVIESWAYSGSEHFRSMAYKTASDFFWSKGQKYLKIPVNRNRTST